MIKKKIKVKLAIDIISKEEEEKRKFLKNWMIGKFFCSNSSMVVTEKHYQNLWVLEIMYKQKKDTLEVLNFN